MMYRVQIDTPQRDGSTVLEWQDRDVPDGTDPPEGAIQLPADYKAHLYTFDTETGVFTSSPSKAEKEALSRLAAAQKAAEVIESDLGAALASSDTWEECQRLKKYTGAEINALEALQKAKLWPCICALLVEATPPQALTAANIAAMATAAENRLWEKKRRFALIQARAHYARQAIVAAATAEEKLAVANNVSWDG